MTLPVDYAARFLTGRVTTPFAALAEATGFSVTRSATLFALLCLNLPPFHQSSKNLASCSLPSPPDPGGSCPGPIPDQPPLCSAGRRPADVWVPCGVSGLAEAWDFSVSSIFRSSLLSSAIPSVAESRKNSFQNTATQVSALGASFRPLVLEACGGGWSHALREVIGWVSTESRAMRGSAGDTPSDVSVRIAQHISCTLHRENARAILRRSPGPVNGSHDLTGDLVSGSAW